MFNSLIEFDDAGNEPSELESDIAKYISDILIDEGYCPYCGNYDDTLDSKIYRCSKCKNISIK